jgi:uncharacterized membrane protein YhaH (DUF805 family)
MTLPIELDYFAGTVRRPFAIGGLTLALAVPAINICFKRFNDLEWPAWLAFALVVSNAAVSIALEGSFTVDGSLANFALSFGLTQQI